MQSKPNSMGKENLSLARISIECSGTMMPRRTNLAVILLMSSAYPDAKVILNVRTHEFWLRSMQNNVLTVLSWRSVSILSHLDRDFTAGHWPLLNCSTSVLSRGIPAYKTAAVPALLESFDQHYDHIRKFLDLPIPEEGFPNINEPKATPAIRFSQKMWGMDMKDHPIACQIPDARPAECPIVAAHLEAISSLIYDWTALKRPGGYMGVNIPQVTLHVRVFNDITIVSISTPHSFRDGIDMKGLLQAWTLLL
ncbi:hypothetical protein FQN49_005552 [Arthroderma sp. PD_2]|nr:hypothetical protein FQN49_005552 [Arthroderma sp. PD_2]